jgi:hypothetical protein
MYCIKIYALADASEITGALSRSDPIWEEEVDATKTQG